VTDEVKDGSDQRRGSRAIALITFLPIAVGIIYLNGWAYYVGYLDYFHLPASMLPLDVQATLLEGVVAWLSGLASILKWTTESLQHHWFLGLLGLAAFAGMKPVAQLAGTLLKLRAFSLRGKWHFPEWLKAILRHVARSTSIIFLTLYGAYTAIFVVAAMILLMVAPFQSIGNATAMAQAKTGFASSPEVVLDAMNGKHQTFKVMSCEGSFCALYSGGRAIAVAREKVTWAVAPGAGPTKSPGGQ
jgi:hypothetical protein